VATVIVAYPWLGSPWRRALKQRWSRQLLGTLGLQLKVGAGRTAQIPSGLLVANHISWLDIFAINALVPAAFVSKDDVRRWPLIGWLSAKTETIFLERGSHAAAQRTRETMVVQLQAGTHVAVFPEGTTSAGDRVLPFHAALFQGAIDAGVPVVPLALRYLDAEGNVSRTPAYDGDITLLQCLMSIVRSCGLVIEIRVLPPIDGAASDRRHVAARSHHAIAWQLGHAGPDVPTPSPSAVPTGRRASGIPGDPQAASP
jgi:1-acyl-sn-glycerol-3-phosphate acyltransferase